MSMVDVNITLPEWCVSVIKAIAKHHGGGSDIPVEVLFSRILYRHMFSVVDAALDMGIPLEELGDGVIEVLLEDIQDMLSKLGINDEEVAYSVFLSMINISTKHNKGEKIED